MAVTVNTLFDPEIARKCRSQILKQIQENFPLDELNLDRHEVAIRKFPWNSGRIHEGITLHPTKESQGSGSCTTDDIGYATAITYVQSSASEDDGIEEVELFRAHVVGEFNNKKIPVDTVFACTVEFGKIILPREYSNNYDASSVLVRCWSETERK